MLYKKFSKKAEIGTTLTWIPAVMIVFFMMFLFVTATAASAGGRFLSWNKNSLEFEDADVSLIPQGLLIKILNTPAGGSGERVEDLVLKWKISRSEELKDQIENVVKEILDEEEFDYVFRVNYAIEKEYGEYFSVRSREVIFPEEISEVNLFYKGGEVKVELWIEDA